jgi:hypothetical protein
VRHAGVEALDQLDAVLCSLRDIEGLVERKPGIFYRGSKAFAHFHEDPSGLYVDVRFETEFERLRVQTKKERAVFVSRVRSAISPSRRRDGHG